VKPARPGLRGNGIVNAPLPFTAFVVYFSPMPLIAPPPLGSETAGGENRGSRSSDLAFALRPGCCSIDFTNAPCSDYVACSVNGYAPGVN
jgi:hypothetical protein